MGGLSRRATFVEEKQKTTENLIVVDAGNFSSPRMRFSGGDQEQYRLKSSLMMESFAHDKIDVVGIGEKDLSLGETWLLDELEKWKIPYIASNLSCGQREIPKQRIVSVAGRNIAFFSFLPKEAKLENCTVSDPLVDWQKMKQQSTADVKVLFSHLPTEQLTGEWLDFDIIIETKTGKRVDFPESLDADTVLLGTGTKGKVIGEAKIHLLPNHHGFQPEGAKVELEKEIDKWDKRLERFAKELEKSPAEKSRLERQIEFYTRKKEQTQQKMERISAIQNAHGIENSLEVLDDKLENHAQISKSVEKTLEAIEQLAQQAEKQKYNGDYVGSLECYSCHVAERKQWSTTNHAHAWTTLKAEKREMDTACFSCHATGVGQKNGPTMPQQVVDHNLTNVGCESCHGPGKEHIRKPSKTNIEKTVSVNICTQCHDGDRDGGQFNQETYWPRIVHESIGN